MRNAKTELQRLEISYLNKDIVEIVLRLTDIAKDLEGSHEQESIKLLRYVRLLREIVDEMKVEIINNLK